MDYYRNTRNPFPGSHHFSKLSGTPEGVKMFVKLKSKSLFTLCDPRAMVSPYCTYGIKTESQAPNMDLSIHCQHPQLMASLSLALCHLSPEHPASPPGPLPLHLLSPPSEHSLSVFSLKLQAPAQYPFSKCPPQTHFKLSLNHIIFCLFV